MGENLDIGGVIVAKVGDFAPWISVELGEDED